jgi:hypothetical protein
MDTHKIMRMPNSLRITIIANLLHRKIDFDINWKHRNFPSYAILARFDMEYDVLAYEGRSSEVLPKMFRLVEWEGHATHIVSHCACLDVA